MTNTLVLLCDNVGGGVGVWWFLVARQLHFHDTCPAVLWRWTGSPYYNDRFVRSRLAQGMFVTT